MNLTIVRLREDKRSFVNTQSRFEINTIAQDTRFPSGYPVLMEETPKLRSRRAGMQLDVVSKKDCFSWFNSLKIESPELFEEIKNERPFKLLMDFVEFDKPTTIKRQRKDTE